MRKSGHRLLPSLHRKQRDDQPEKDIMFSWQQGGYHMEHSQLDSEEGVTDSNDRGYQVVGYQGSAPDWMDPFHDSGVDTSLVKVRSMDLMDHRGMFWADSRDNYAPSAAGEAVMERETPWFQKILEKARELQPGQVLRPLSLFLSMVVFLVIMRFLVLDIRTVSVVGVSRVSPQDVIELSGIRTGMSILNLNEKAIAQRIESNPLLTFSYLENVSTHEVAIHVRERRGEAYVKIRGVIYVLDSRGMILEEETNTNPANEDIEGQKRLQEITEGRVMLLLGNVGTCRVGSRIQVDSRTQSVMTEIFRELKAMSMEGLVTEITLSNSGSVSMTTSNGYSVRFGDGSRVHAKLRVLSLVAQELQKENSFGGTIDVEIPETPTWIPENL